MRHTKKLTPIILLLTSAACRLMYVIDPKMEYSPVQIVICSAGSAPDKILTASPCIINLLFIFLFFLHIFTSVLVYITYHSIHKHCRKREENNNKGIQKSVPCRTLFCYKYSLNPLHRSFSRLISFFVIAFALSSAASY